MGEVWVVNSSPIIALARTSHLSLLERLPDELLVPDAVVREVRAGPEEDPARQAIESGWGTRAADQDAPAAISEWGLGAGETAVLTLAQKRGATAVLDDAAARTCARVIGVSVIGTLGVILRARRKGMISSAEEVVRALAEGGLYLDRQTVSTALRHVGETWES